MKFPLETTLLSIGLSLNVGQLMLVKGITGADSQVFPEFVIPK